MIKDQLVWAIGRCSWSIFNIFNSCFWKIWFSNKTVWAIDLVLSNRKLFCKWFNCPILWFEEIKFVFMSVCPTWTSINNVCNAFSRRLLECKHLTAGFNTLEIAFSKCKPILMRNSLIKTIALLFDYYLLIFLFNITLITNAFSVS